MEPIRILMAVPDVKEEVISEFREVIQKANVEVGKIEARSTKSLVQQYLASHSGIDVIILSQYQGSDASYSPSDIDDISMECQKALIIPIISEERGGKYVADLSARGIYSALFEEDASFQEISSLISKGGRTKAEARAYYGIIKHDSAAVQDDVFDTRSAITFLSKYDGTVDDLAMRLDSLEVRLSTQDFKSVLLDVPDDIFEMVSRIDDYSKVCALLEDQRRFKARTRAKTKLISRDANTSGDQGKKKGLFGKRKEKKADSAITPAEQISMVSTRQTYEAGFISTNVGVGCTTCAVLFAASVANTHKDLKVALVEFDDADENFDALCMTVTGHRNTSGLNIFKVGNVDLCFHLKYSEFINKYRLKYDLCVYDFGCLKTDLIREYFLPLDYKFVVTSPALWKNYELVDFVKEVRELDKDNSFIYMVPSVVENDAALPAETVAPNTVVAVPYESNPLKPSGDTCELLKRIYDRNYKYDVKKLGKALNVSDPCSKKSISSRNVPKGLIIGLSLAGMIALFTVTAFALRERRIHESVVSQMQAAIQEKDERLKTLEASEGELASQLTGLKRTVVVLKNDAKPGEKISTINTEVVEVRSEVGEELFLSPEKIDKVVACVGISAGVPIYDSETAYPVKAPEEKAEEVVPESEPENHR